MDTRDTIENKLPPAPSPDEFDGSGDTVSVNTTPPPPPAPSPEPAETQAAEVPSEPQPDNESYTAPMPDFDSMVSENKQEIDQPSYGDVDGEVDPTQTWPDEPHRITEEHIDPLLLWCVAQGSSDVTFQSDRPLYNDISGVLHPGTKRALDGADLTNVVNKIYGTDAMARLASGTDLDLSYEVRPDRNSRVRFRVNITAILSQGRDGVQVTMRVLPSEPPTMDDLDIEPELREYWTPRDGLVLVTGPTGSGKSTLLAAGNRMMIEREQGCGKMLTYEAPIEYTYDTIAGEKSLISQTEIPRHLPSFEDGVRNALRRKPNVILVGEARDRETISAAIEAGQTGHAVYSTVHTTGVANTIRRMVATFQADEREERAYALMETMRPIVTQILVQKKGGGRIGLREWLVFDEDLREKMLDMDYDKWSVELMRLVPQRGQSMAQSATKAFEADLIDVTTYKMITKGSGE